MSIKISISVGSTEPTIAGKSLLDMMHDCTCDQIPCTCGAAKRNVELFKLYDDIQNRIKEAKSTPQSPH